MSNKKEKNFYVKKKRTLLRQFDAATTLGKDILIAKFGEQKYEEFVKEAREEFESLIPELPYIGGKDNSLTWDIEYGAMMLPLFRIFEREGLDFDEIGKLSYDLFEALFAVIPQEEVYFTEEYMNQQRENAKISKLRKYPYDWVYDFVEGDGKTFDWGYDFLECGLYNFFKSKGFERFVPFFCLADFEMSRAYGYGLIRTKIIANGAPLCDFRYVKDGTNPRGWPPYDLPEFKNKK